MSERAALKFLVWSLAVFGAAFAVRWVFFWNVVPVSWEQETQPVWTLETAFFVRSIENLGLAVAAVMAVVTLALWINRRRRSEPR